MYIAVVSKYFKCHNCMFRSVISFITTKLHELTLQRGSLKACVYSQIVTWHSSEKYYFIHFNTLRPRQNGRHFADDTFALKENVRISIKISLNFVPKSPIDNISALFQMMAWRRPGDKPLSEAIMVSLLTHICVARPQWVLMSVKLLLAPYQFNMDSNLAVNQ